MNRTSITLIVAVLPAIVACNDADDPLTIQGVDDDSSVLLESVGSEVLKQRRAWDSTLDPRIRVSTIVIRQRRGKPLNQP